MVKEVAILLPIKFRQLQFNGIGVEFKQEAYRDTYRAIQYNVPLFFRNRPGRQFGLLIGSNNANLVEDNEIMLPIIIWRIPLSTFRGEVENVSENQTPEGPSGFSGRHEKIQTWKRTLRSCFLSSFVVFRSVVSEEKSEMSQQIRYQNGHLVFPVDPKNTNLVEDVAI